VIYIYIYDISRLRVNIIVWYLTGGKVRRKEERKPGMASVLFVLLLMMMMVKELLWAMEIKSPVIVLGS